MKRIPIHPWLIVTCAIALQSCAVAAEPAQRFLDELRNRGYYDMAVEYLQRLPESRNLPADFRATIDYEVGVTLIEKTTNQPQDAKEQEESLLLARTKLEAFLAANSTHSLANVARTKLGRVQANRAANRKREADSPRTSEAEKQTLRQEAIELYDDARRIYEEGRAAIGQQLQGMQSQYDSEAEPEKAKQLTILRNEYVDTRFLAAVAQFEKAMVFPGESEARTATLTDAATRFDSIIKDYRTRAQAVMQTLQSFLYLGRCHQEIGKLKEAVTFYLEITKQRKEILDHPAVRTIAAECIMRAIDCWNSDQQKLYEAAIQQGEQWLKTERPDERRNVRFLGLKSSLAQSYLEKSKTVGSSDRDKAVNNARRLLNEVSKAPSPYQREAQELFVSITKSTQTADGRKPPDDFADAFEQASEVRDEHQVAMATVKLLTKRLDDVANEATRTAIQTEIDAATTKLEELRRTEIRLLQQAIRLAGDDATDNQLHSLRYYLAIYYYLSEDDYRASVLGEFIARRYSDTRFGQHAARVALTSLKRIRSNDADFAGDASTRLTNIAGFLLQRWPDSDGAKDAIEIIIGDAIEAKDYDRAEEYLGKLDEKSDRRAKLELYIGQTIWADYLKQRKMLGSGQTSDSLTATKDRALKLLNAGIESKRAEGVSSALVQAQLSLASSYVDGGDFAKALELLEDPASGPLTLVAQNSILTEGMERRTYLLSIQALIGSLPTSPNTQAVLDKAMQSMDALKDKLSGVPNGQQALTAEYIKLAQALQSQIQEAQPGSRDALAAGYERVLDRIANASDNATTLAWTAESFEKLASLLTGPGGATTAKGRALARRSMELYQQVLARSDVDDQLRNILRLRVAIAMRESGSFEAAVAEFVKLLDGNEMQVHVQIEAAKTFQAWGNEDKNAYKKAIVGAEFVATRRQNLIWGWGRLSTVLARDAKFRELFHECRYNLELCRYHLAMKSGKTDKEKHLHAARNEIVMTSRMYPELGGSERKQEYDALLKKVQVALGDKPTGIAQ
ncbi:MAG: hypothetical protein KDB27_29540 [Planctomycetales bacterium]|nr:hypothetical protein [Planctomycetales bacterium]